MKIRTDFVTNSSSSSFIAVFGTETDKILAESSNKLSIYKDNIFTGKYLKENWNDIKRKYTSEWFCVDPFPAKKDIVDDKLYFAYWSSQELTESEDGDGYDYEEVKQHENDVDSYLENLKGFDLEFDSWEGRDG